MNGCRVLFLRHGETTWNAERRIQGTKDVPLTEAGMAQIRAVCGRLKDECRQPFAGIVTSPLRRARQSAELCGELLGVPVTESAWFRERSFGQLEGLTACEIRLRCGIPDVERIRDSSYGIEPLQTVTERIQSGLDWLRQAYGGRTVLVVTHGSVIKRIAEILGTPAGIIGNGCYREWLV
ncbi:hypothetical protein GE107_16215 [Cohnella sp. CFH 77786]|uniref:histidine phosphatase family protein n=1 Tax=Cohnella sp. CFH 77786 TaxID=2662265 RepID=UPI001C60D3E8|nr:hypothetical protein [Cohnella sp. CFH 77786]